MQVWQLTVIMFAGVILYNLIDGDFMGALVLLLFTGVIAPIWYLVETRMANNSKKRELRLNNRRTD